LGVYVLAIKSGSTGDKSDGFENNHTMSEMMENNSTNDGQPSVFEISDVNIPSKAGISAKLKNMNTWNMQKDLFCNTMADKESLPYQNLEPLLNNTLLMVKLK
jgi:hypothetical protein